MYNVFYMYLRLEERRLGMRERVKSRNDNGIRIWIFSQKLPFSVIVEKNCFKEKLRKYNTLTYTSYNKYFRLCLVSEQLRLNEIGLFLQQYRFSSFDHVTEPKGSILFERVHGIFDYVMHLFMIAECGFRKLAGLLTSQQELP